MKTTSCLAASVIAAFAFSIAALSTPAQAVDVQALLNANGCLGCHGLLRAIEGPGYHEVAEQYKGDPNVRATLAKSIRMGSENKWGDSPMPAFAKLTDEDVKALVEFVLKQ